MLPRFSKAVLRKAGVLFQQYCYKKDRELPLRGGKVLQVKAKNNVDFYKVGPDIHLVYQGQFYLPHVQDQHKTKLFKAYDPARVLDDHLALQAYQLLNQPPGQPSTSQIIAIGDDDGSEKDTPSKTVGERAPETVREASRTVAGGGVPPSTDVEAEECPMCSRKFPFSELLLHAATCEGPEADAAEAADLEEERRVGTCPLCGLELDLSLLPDHAADCQTSSGPSSPVQADSEENQSKDLGETLRDGMKGSSPETHRAEMKGPVLLFLECEILRDGTYSQFTQLGSFVDLNGAAFTPTSSTSTNTYTFQANIIVKHKSLYDHYKQSQDMTSLLNQEGVKLEKEDEAINKFYRRLDRCLSGRPVVIVTNSQVTVALLKAKSTAKQFSVFTGVIYLGELLKEGGRTDLDFSEELETEDVYRVVMKRDWKKKGARSPNCAMIAEFTSELVNNSETSYPSGRFKSETPKDPGAAQTAARTLKELVADPMCARTSTGDQTIKELEIAYSYSPAAPVLINLKYYIDFVVIEDDEDDDETVDDKKQHNRVLKQEKPTPSYIECPVCDRMFPAHEIEEHASGCQGLAMNGVNGLHVNVMDEQQKCSFCLNLIPLFVMEEHVEECQARGVRTRVVSDIERRNAIKRQRRF